MNMTTSLIAVAALAAVASPATASPRRTTTTETYRVTYEDTRDVYCIRFFSDAQAADPHPGSPGVTCRSRAAWAKQGIRIDDPLREMAKATRS
ncbi:MAG: hypothetical protein WC804_12680 [Sphingomonas sp.]|uniref:hypothetical protein n=1 Tax=Sphingomonas sp. TaxID=28214 RepID=UPI003565CC0A